MSERFETVVIGGGQAGLSMGYHLAKRGKPFVILEAADRVGGGWLNRWDSLLLFTPATHDGLPGTPYPGGYGFPRATELAAYMADYADQHGLPVRTGVHVDGLFRDGDGFKITAGNTMFEADNVILATGTHRKARVPAFGPELSDDIVQMHSNDYRNPGQLKPGPVLLVGAGNSGADIAMETIHTHRTLLAGRHPGHIPLDINSFKARLLFPLIWFVWSHVLTIKTPPGRKMSAQGEEHHGDPLIRVKPHQMDAAGIERIARIAGVVDGRPQTEDGTVLDVANVIWCTGFDADLDWIDLPGLDSSRGLAHDRGRVEGQPGLYALGHHFQYSFASHLVGGVGRDAEFLVKDIARRASSAQATPLAVRG